MTFVTLQEFSTWSHAKQTVNRQSPGKYLNVYLTAFQNHTGFHKGHDDVALFPETLFS